MKEQEEISVSMDETEGSESSESKTKELSEFEKELGTLPENAQRAVRRFRTFAKKCLSENAVKMTADNMTAPNYVFTLCANPTFNINAYHSVLFFQKMFMTSEEMQTYSNQVQSLVVNKNYFMPQVELKVKRKTWKKTK